MRTLLLVLVGALVLAAPPSLEAQFPRRLPTGQPCSSVDAPPLALGQVVDSAAVHRELAGLSMGDADTVMIKISFEKSGRVEKVYRAYGSANAAATTAAVLAVDRYATAKPASSKGSLRYLLVTGGASPRVEIPQLTYACAPQIQNRQTAATLLADALNRLPESIRRLPPERMSTTLVFMLSPAGIPEEVRVTRSSGFPELDREAAHVLRQMRFHPAQLDGRPVAAFTTQPIRFRYQGGR